MITQEDVIKLFNYKDGNLYWKENKGKIEAGTRAGCKHSNGYQNIKIDYKLYKEHRLVFLYHNGYFPDLLDHIDGVRDNNKIENLRPVTKFQNQMNRRSQKNSSSKYKGVSWHKNNKKWRVYIYINGKNKYLGSFKNEKDAAIAYNKQAEKHHGKFALLNEV